jgi:exopolysaccharide production protein ExoQ
MISLLATVLCLGFVVYLYRMDPRSDDSTTSALWIPFTWMFFAASRYPTSWIGFSMSEASSYDEGSPLDRAFFMALIAAGLIVLMRRRVSWGAVAGSNVMLLLYLGYCLVSVLWSDEPGIAARRWFKDLGNPVMVLVVLTEPRPLAALATLWRRLAYVLIPMSVLFVRYYPELGRVYAVDGTPTYTGVGQQKNALGQMCLVIGIYLAWQWLYDRDTWRTWPRGLRACILALIAMLVWLLWMSNSQTSLACLLVAVAVLALAKLVRRRPARLSGLLVLAVLTAWALEETVGIREPILDLLGRDPSLTNRADLWELISQYSPSPLIGAGFMSFWTGERMAAIWSELGTPVLQAHSGYIEQYLNLGYIGVALTVLMMFAAYWRLRRDLRTDAPFSVLRLCFLAAAALYNYTEASFYGFSNVWILLLFVLIEVPRSATYAAASGTSVAPRESPNAGDRSPMSGGTARSVATL